MTAKKKDKDRKRPPRTGEGRPPGWKPAEHGADPGGRPKIYTDFKVEELGEDLVEWAQLTTSLFIESWCKLRRTHRQRIAEFAKSNSKFADCLKTAKDAVASNIAERTAADTMPTAFGIFAMKQHEWTDRHEHTGAGGGNLFPPENPTKDEKRIRAIAAKRVLDAIGDA
jgi:hypothetical protein